MSLVVECGLPSVRSALSGANGPRVTWIRSLATVSQVLRGGAWALPHGRHPIITLLKACLPNELPDKNSPLDDFFLWRNTIGPPPGIFSSAKTWILFILLLPLSPGPKRGSKSGQEKDRARSGREISRSSPEESGTATGTCYRSSSDSEHPRGFFGSEPAKLSFMKLS
ncbi:unnamed protein product [Microthlaspi erraticum]|uniref:Uncharacterized protein n=1 Tax=Microthlaspi erraticum TaxID=1685480 RepID=A0A6D2K791_9BRAS|nr:unnamed protein product [Microthlaspi erraticum]CAA7045453.1 unnamed protein product [Microthlaspi erraticum]